MPGVGLHVAGEDLHEGGLAGAVRAGEAVAAPGGERDVHVLEELLAGEGLGDVGDGDHAQPSPRGGPCGRRATSTGNSGAHRPAERACANQARDRISVTTLGGNKW